MHLYLLYLILGDIYFTFVYYLKYVFFVDTAATYHSRLLPLNFDIIHSFTVIYHPIITSYPLPVSTYWLLICKQFVIIVLVYNSSMQNDTLT